jgi:hypothetical protein
MPLHQLFAPRLFLSVCTHDSSVAIRRSSVQLLNGFGWWHILFRAALRSEHCWVVSRVVLLYIIRVIRIGVSFFPIACSATLRDSLWSHE